MYSKMTIRCNVCKESPTINTPKPEREDQLCCCPECDKQLAYVVKSKPYGKNQLTWYPLDYKYDPEWGGIPVLILSCSY